MLYIHNKSLFFFMLCTYGTISYSTPNTTIAHLIQEYNTIASQRLHVIQRKKFLQNVIFDTNIDSLQEHTRIYQQELMQLTNSFITSQTEFFKHLEIYFRQNKSNKNTLLPTNLYTMYKYIKQSSGLLYVTSIKSVYNTILKQHNTFYISLKKYLYTRQCAESTNSESYLLKIDPQVYIEAKDPEYFLQDSNLFEIVPNPEDYLEDTSLFEIPEQQILDTDWTFIPLTNKAHFNDYDEDNDFLYNFRIYKYFGKLPNNI